MDLSKIHAAIKRVIKKHSEAFIVIGGSQPKLLELASITGFAEHYKAHSFHVRVHNPKGKSYFAMKAGTNGDPWNFSYFSANDGIENVELHMNVKVRSAHDTGMYCVDVGVVRAGAIPREKPAAKWECLPNPDLVTFGESKKLVVYPMLLAQFIGIVHEIKPGYLNYAVAAPTDHPPPTLIALGSFSGNSRAIVNAYPGRSIKLNIAQNYDVRLARVRGSSTPTSPFYSDEV
jgi:hypothetical protein